MGAGDADQGDDPLRRPEPGPVHGVDCPTHEPPLVQLRHGCLLGGQPGLLRDPRQRIAQRVRMAWQRLLLPPGRVPMLPILPLAHLHRVPAQAQQDPRLAEQRVRERAEAAVAQERQHGHRPQEHARGQAGATAHGVHRLHRREHPQLICSAIS